MTSSSGFNDAKKPSILIIGGIHAREWLAPATLIHMINTFTTRHLSDPNVKLLLEKFNWYFVPVVNPDGYEYSRNQERLWRKTRSPQNGTGCVGVDGNRNFGYHWGSTSFQTI